MGRDTTFTIVVLQVDDGKVVGNSAADIQALKKVFAQYNTKWHGPCESYLGAEETRPEPVVIKVTSREQIDRFAERYADHLSGKRVSVPARVADKYRAGKDMNATGFGEREKMKEKPFRQMIGSARYPARLCHPTLSYSLNEVAQYMQDPGLGHWTLLQIVGNFLLKLNYRRRMGSVFAHRRQGPGSSYRSPKRWAVRSSGPSWTISWASR